MAHPITNVTDLKHDDVVLGLDNGHGGLIDVIGTVTHVAHGLLILSNAGQLDRHVATCTGMRFHVA